MHKKILFTILLVIAVQTAVIPGASISLNTDAIKNIAVSDLINIRIPPLVNVDADVYSGSAQINIENGDQKRIDFFGTFIPNDGPNCTYSRCFVGWIDNYTISGEDTVLGYTNQSLVIKPVFEFRTNSQVDFVIFRNPNLAETWVQIIEILCQKINPQVTQSGDKSYSTAKTQTFTVQKSAVQSFSASQAATSADVQQPQESLTPQFNFQTIQASDISTQTSNFAAFRLSSPTLKLAVGDKVGKLETNIPIDGLKTTNSLYTQTLVLSNQNVVKSRSIDYKLSLPSDGITSDKGEKLTGLNGLITLNFGFAQKIKSSTSNIDAVKNLLAGNNRASFNYNAINDRRAKLGEYLEPNIKLVVDDGPTFEQAQILKVDNEVNSGINIQNQLSGVSAVSNNFADIAVLSQNTAVRNLQLLSNTTIYNYKKVLVSQTIFGKTFSADIEVKCYVLMYPSDHQIQCIGTFNYQLFGKVKSITIFKFKKSVVFSWSWSNQYKGNWGFNVWVGLPSPFNFIGLNFSFNVSYVIDISISINAGSSVTPYVVKCNALATTKVNTDASAGVKVIAIEGGVFISGTLVNAGTDPKFTLTYYFQAKPRYLNINAQWYFWLNAFNYKWGFYYKTWSFWSGWSGRKIIKQWTINGVYGKWAIVNKSWNVTF